jgi:hypothetical protein
VRHDSSIVATRPREKPDESCVSSGSRKRGLNYSRTKVSKREENHRDHRGHRDVDGARSCRVRRFNPLPGSPRCSLCPLWFAPRLPGAPVTAHFVAGNESDDVENPRKTATVDRVPESQSTSICNSGARPPVAALWGANPFTNPDALRAFRREADRSCPAWRQRRRLASRLGRNAPSTPCGDGQR